jgi:hypothetical protein
VNASLLLKRHLDLEEREALSGMWNLTLNLEDEAAPRSITCHLDASGRLRTTSAVSTEVPGSWEAKAAPSDADFDGDAVELNFDKVSLKMHLGPLKLHGVGMRQDLRCSMISGWVVEGDHEPCCVGTFEMRLSLSAVDDMDALALRYRRRLDNKPAPPPRFRKAGFVGIWQLLLTMESDGLPKLVSLRLGPDGSFATASAEGDAAGKGVLRGRWGVWDNSMAALVGRKEAQRLHKGLGTPLGTHVWLHFLSGLGRLNQQETYSAHGRPVLTGFAQELRAKSAEGADADRVEGNVYFGGSSDREYYLAGRFTLVRDAGAEATRDAAA